MSGYQPPIANMASLLNRSHATLEFIDPTRRPCRASAISAAQMQGMQTTMSRPIPLDRPHMVTDDTMHPRYNVGTYVMTTKFRSPQIGTKVLATRIDGTRMIREVVSIDRDTIKLKQYNPNKSETFEIDVFFDISVIRYSFET
ncbi:MAG: hypothetical protein JKY47_02330 [Thalassospira sp.]|nr:hypothetical protein [Thalassospira sp.]